MADEKDTSIFPAYDDEEGPGHAHAALRSPANASTSVPSGDAEGERRVRREIEDAAPENTKLLNDLMTTEESVSALQNNEVRLRHVKDELSDQDKTVQNTTDASQARFKTYSKDRASVARKWYYILTKMRDTFAEKVKQSESNYHEALAAQSQAENRQKELQRDMDAIEKENEGLGEHAKTHMAAHDAIDKLYETIFAGPTPGFADEDEREKNHDLRKAEHEATTTTLKGIAKTRKEIDMLKTTIDRAKSENRRAEYEVEASFFGVDYPLIYLERCAMLIDRGLKRNKDAFDAAPQPPDRKFLELNTAIGRHLTSAYKSAAIAVNESYASRREVAECIRSVADDLQLASDAQKDMAVIVKKDEANARQAVRITARHLEDARQALQEIRQGAFELTVGFGAAAPPYHECCDRAEGYCVNALGQAEQIVVSAVSDEGLPPPPSYDKTTGQNGAEEREESLI